MGINYPKGNTTNNNKPQLALSKNKRPKLFNARLSSVKPSNLTYQLNYILWFIRDRNQKIRNQKIRK